jgi:hypothetical protein
VSTAPTAAVAVVTRSVSVVGVLILVWSLAVVAAVVVIVVVLVVVLAVVMVVVMIVIVARANHVPGQESYSQHHRYPLS